VGLGSRDAHVRRLAAARPWTSASVVSISWQVRLKYAGGGRR
jgi:hypothetical protein